MDDKRRFDQLLKWSEEQTKYKKMPYGHNPEINTIDVTPKPFKFEFKYKMPLGKRIDLFLISMSLLFFSLIALGVIGFLLYCFVLGPLFQ